MERVDADLLIPGRGEPLRDVSVVMDSGVITYLGPISDAPGTATTCVRVVMPGMWECHGHFMGLSTMHVEELMQTPPVVAAARAARNVEETLQAGFTSVREAGGLGVYLQRVIEEGFLSGPTIYGPGAILSTTGGHGDIHSYPVEWVHDLCERQGFNQLCDGVPECLKAVRLQLRKGARVIKVCASGGVMSEIDHPVHQQFSDEELRAIVDEAGRAERIVMAHCHGKPGIMAALRAGVRTIEHGSYLDEEAAIAMREAGAILVPTRFIVEQGLLSKDRMPEYAFRKLTALADSHLQAMKIAHQSGVTIALGTDIFAVGPKSGMEWGMNGRELVHLVDAGLSPAEAIQAATFNGPLTLGPQAPRSGLLAEGYDADVIAVSANPLDDISVLADRNNVTHVWKAGNLVKSPRRGPDPSS
jgi:imidazolonepropionase-like amidohydrolase